MNADRPTIAIIGCGNQAPKHIDGIRAAAPGAVILVQDVNAAIASALAASHKVQAIAAVAQIFEDPSVDGVIIATPTPFHAPLIDQALSAGKQVFCEKPLCATRAEAEAIVAASERTGRFVQVGYVYRFVPAFQRLHQLLHDPAQPLGTPTLALLRIGGRGSQSAWKHTASSGGGVINEMLPHMLDLSIWLLGPWRDHRWLERLLVRHTRTIDGKTTTADAEDQVILSGTTTGGAHVVCQADMLSPAFQQHVELQGDNGSFFGSIQENLPAYVQLSAAKGGWKAGRHDLSGGTGAASWLQMANFLDNIRAGAASGCATAHDSLSFIDIIERVQE